MQTENMAKLLESGKVMSCGSWLLIPHHAGVDQSYTALQSGSNEILTFRNVNDVTWKFQDAHSFEVIDNFQLPTKYGRDKFMEFFRTDEFHEKISVDDAHEVFSQILHGSSDFTKELLESTAKDYGVDLPSVLNLFEEDYEMLASENQLFAKFLENQGYTQDQITDIANSGEIIPGTPFISRKKESFNVSDYTNERLIKNELEGSGVVVTDEIMEMAMDELNSGLTTSEAVSETILHINTAKNKLFTQDQTQELARVLVNTRDFCGDELGAAKQYCVDEKIDINSGIYRDALIEADTIWSKARIDASALTSIAKDAPVGSTLADAVKAVSTASQSNKLSL